MYDTSSEDCQDLPVACGIFKRLNCIKFRIISKETQVSMNNIWDTIIKI